MTDPRPADDSAEPLLAALMEWRQRLIDAGAVSPTSLKEVHIRQVARYAPTDVDQIRAMLPGSVAEHAEDLARVLSALQSAPAASPAPPVPPAPTPPAPPPSHPAHQQAPTAPPPAPGARPPAQATQHPRTVTMPAATQAPAAAEFAPYTFTTPPSADVQAISRRRLAGPAGPGPLEFSWPPYLPGPDAGGEAVVIHRLVSGDDNPPIAPDRAFLVAATTATSARDDRPADAAVRHYQVWANVGPTRAAALAAQPVKHAEIAVIGSVLDFQLRDDGGQVIGRWHVPPQVSQVHVYRVPAEHVGSIGPQFRISADTDNLSGFRDADVERGRRYRYVVRAAVVVDGSLRLSDDPVERVIEIAAVLAPVTDLAMVPPSGGPTFDVTWTPPVGGDVVVYRTPNGPSAGTEATELPETALDQVGLRGDFRLNQLVTGHQTSAVMVGVSWPPGWNRVCLTPVTVVNGRALIGRTVSSVRTGNIRDVDLAEYCNKQVLTFNWPEGAHSVVVYPAQRGYDPRHGLTGRSFEITEETYERNGGLQLAAGELPYRGCSLHLQPVAYSAGRRVEGEIRSVEYFGLVRLWYGVRIARDPDGQPVHATVSMWAQEDIASTPSFVLINNPDRIPLSRNDGDAVDVAPLGPGGQLIGEQSKTLQWSSLTTQPTQEVWAAKLRGRQGWIRLFANTASAERLSTIALLDPPVEHLRLTSAAIR